MEGKQGEHALAPQSIDTQNEIEETQRALREINLMIEQSQGELGKLTQRNASITAHLQLVQKQGQVPADELKMAYDSALDAQQRLFVMRSQLEKLQNDKTHLEKYKAVLEKIGAGPVMVGSSSTATAVKGPLAEVENIIKAQEAERQRLSRQMHDGPAQALSNFILQTEIAMRLLDADPAQAKEELANLKSSAMKTFQKVRNFIFELRPMMLDDLGLVPTIRKYVDALKEQTNIEIGITVMGNERRLESYLEVMIFRAIQELLGNAVRHGQCSAIKLHVDLGNEKARISVDDNGKGFDQDSMKLARNLGLKLIRERAEMLGGTFEIDSQAGRGTRVVFSVPVRG
jgi:two-component system sensor histidine kinase DegS